MASKPKIVVVFDNSMRPDTTGGYCLRALQDVAEVTHILPRELASLDPACADLFLRIDDGYDCIWPTSLHPSCYWCIDTHVDYALRLRHAHHFDKVFCAQKSGAEQMRADGIAAQWLPLACDPVLHGRQEVLKEHDICMVGHISPGHPRSDLVALLQAHHSSTFAGTRPYQELGQAYSASRLAFNRSLSGDLNMRVFEALCAGTLLLTDHLESGLTDLFQPGRHLVTYRTAEELLEKASFYLMHERERESIAETGRREVLARHTYAHRIQEILTAFDLSSRKKGKGTSSLAPRRISVRSAPDSPQPALPTGVPEDPEIFCTPQTHASEIGQHYYDYPRPEVQARVPLNARRILDIGCAGGRLGEAIKQRSEQAGLERPVVVGVEMNAEVAARAATRLDAVLVGDIERLLSESQTQLLTPLHDALSASDPLPAPAKPRKRTRATAPVSTQSGATEELSNPVLPRYDCIVLADALEHLRDPETVLRSLRALLADDGTLVLSVPNVGHRDILQGLAHGRWTYAEAGLLDRTHLRFFTRRDLEQALFRAGFDVADIGSVSSPEHQDWVELGRPGTLKFDHLTLTDIDPVDAEGFFTIQWLVRARKRPQQDHGLTSIIILTMNQMAYTRACIDSIRAHTPEPYELIFVDNGSSDHTLLYLKSLCGVTIIRNETNQGFPRGCNQGIAEARGTNILLLNNDTVVTEGWLTRLLEALYSAEDIGAVGPRSHGTIGAQQCRGPWPDVAKADDYAWDMARVHAARRTPVPLLIGFCFLARQSALAVVGPLDERFGIGLFEDNDLSKRFLQSGFRMLCACDAYVYHHVSTTFKGEKVDISAQYRMAEEQYKAKWGEDASSSSSSRDNRSDEAIVVLPALPETPRISACVLSHGDPEALRDCLDSLRAGVDEIIILAIGTDEPSAQVAEEYDARIESIGSGGALFSARCAAYARASGDWILWMDANERLPTEHLSTLQELARTQSTRLAGYLFACRYVEAPGEHGIPRAYQVRMLRRHEALPFVYVSEEEILPALGRAGLDVASAPIEILHLGDERNSDQAQEQELQQWSQENERRPHNPFALHGLGCALNALRRWKEAVPALQEAVALFSHDVPSLPKTMAELSRAYQHLHGPQAALQIAMDGLALWPRDPELLFRTADLLYQLGRPQDAGVHYERILSGPPCRHCVNVGEGILSYQTRHGMGLALRAIGQLDASERLLREALQDNPHYLPAWLTLAEVLLQKADVMGAWEALRRLLEIEPGDPDALALRGKIRMERNEMAAARRDLALSVVHNPGNPRSRRILADLLLRIGLFPEAERELSAVVAQDPRDAGSLARLAALLSQSRRARAAIGLYQRALALQPGEPNVQFGLAMALKETGETAAAADHFRQIVQRFPDHDEALYEWGEAAFALGDREHARVCFQRVVERNSGHIAAKSALAALGTSSEAPR